jgi:glycosyltransferase involved in cell wall biosynthesis
MLGARMHFALPAILADAGLLHTLYTDTYIGNKPWLRAFAGLPPEKLRFEVLKRMSGRVSDRIPPDRVVSFDLLGLSYFWKRRQALTSAALAELFTQVNTRFGNSVVRTGLSDTKYVLGFNGAALEIFTHARERGIKCILEQTMAPRKFELEILRQENDRWPHWQSEIPENTTDPLAEREAAEWRLADTIICGSQFVAEALQREGVEANRIRVVPYGIDLKTFKAIPPRHDDGTLRILFAGEIGLRKGVPYLLEALRALDRPEQIQARLVGPVTLQPETLSPYSRWCEVLGSVSRQQILSFYEWADVLVLPSLCEGSATVTYEAMACGLPIITTPASGALVRDGIDGFIVRTGDSGTLGSRIAMLAEDIQLRLKMSSAAADRRQEISLTAYADRLLKALGLKATGNGAPADHLAAAAV